MTDAAIQQSLFWGMSDHQVNQQSPVNKKLLSYQRFYTMPKNNHPAKMAITIAGDKDRTHYFDDRSSFDDFVRGLLVGEDELREFSTDFKLYSKVGGEWVEQDFDPYDYFDDIDDTDYPLAHGQLLANYGTKIDHKILWNLAQGNDDAIVLISDASLREQVRNTYKTLHEAGAWASDEEDPAFTEYLDSTEQELYAIATQGTSFVDEDEPKAWLTDI